MQREYWVLFSLAVGLAYGTTAPARSGNQVTMPAGEAQGGRSNAERKRTFACPNNKCRKMLKLGWKSCAYCGISLAASLRIASPHAVGEVWVEGVKRGSTGQVIPGLPFGSRKITVVWNGEALDREVVLLPGLLKEFALGQAKKTRTVDIPSFTWDTVELPKLPMAPQIAPVEGDKRMVLRLHFIRDDGQTEKDHVPLGLMSQFPQSYTQKEGSIEIVWPVAPEKLAIHYTKEVTDWDFDPPTPERLQTLTLDWKKAQMTTVKQPVGGAISPPNSPAPLFDSATELKDARRQARQVKSVPSRRSRTSQPLELGTDYLIAAGARISSSDGGKWFDAQAIPRLDGERWSFPASYAVSSRKETWLTLEKALTELDAAAEIFASLRQEMRNEGGPVGREPRGPLLENLMRNEELCCNWRAAALWRQAALEQPWAPDRGQALEWMEESVRVLAEEASARMQAQLARCREVQIREREITAKLTTDLGFWPQQRSKVLPSLELTVDVPVKRTSISFRVPAGEFLDSAAAWVVMGPGKMQEFKRGSEYWQVTVPREWLRPAGLLLRKRGLGDRTFEAIATAKRRDVYKDDNELEPEEWLPVD